MDKIKTLYIRDPKNPRLVTREVEPECQWVIDGEGEATEKIDGTACLIRFGKLFKRHRVKPGKQVPEGWVHHDFGTGSTEGHGWVPVGEGKADRYHREAHDNQGVISDGTYELVGPKVQGNPYEMNHHWLHRHGTITLYNVPPFFRGLGLWFASHRKMEGIVWHHPDGRMAKIKRRDFGLQWPVKEEK